MYLCVFINFSYSNSLHLAFPNLYVFLICLLVAWSLLDLFLSLETPAWSPSLGHAQSLCLCWVPSSSRHTPVSFITASDALFTCSLPPAVLHRNMAEELVCSAPDSPFTLPPALLQHGKGLVEVSFPYILKLDPRNYLHKSNLVAT